MPKHQTFFAMAQGKVDYSLQAIHTHTEEYGDMLTICATEEAVYITKAQAMEFFGLIEPTPILMAAAKAVQFELH